MKRLIKYSIRQLESVEVVKSGQIDEWYVKSVECKRIYILLTGSPSVPCDPGSPLGPGDPGDPTGPRSPGKPRSPLFPTRPGSPTGP